MIRRIALLAITLAALDGCANQDIYDTGESAIGVYPRATSAVFYVDNASWADIHFRINGGGQLNYRMAVSGTHNEYTINGLTAGTVVDYSFTYFDLGCPCAKDSPWFKYTHGGAPPPPVDAGIPVDAAPPVDAPPSTPGAYPVPTIPPGPTTGGSDLSGTAQPLYPSTTTLEPATVIDTPSALITRFGDRVRDRHAREAVFHIYEHFLPLYFQDRTFSIEIVDKVAKGGTEITVNLTTVHPQDKPNFRAFFRGLNTVAEYFHNADFTAVDDYHYTATVTYNAKEGHAVRVGDRMEVEVGIFLRDPIVGRFNYYSSVSLYVVGTGGIQPFQGVGPQLDSFALPAPALLGGGTTLNYPYSNEPDKRFMQMATNIAPVSAQPWVEGRRLLHTDFIDGTHSEPDNPVFTEQANKIGPHYVARSCESCHVNNGRSLPPAIGAVFSTSVMKVGVVNGAQVTAHPQLGGVLQPFSPTGAIEGTGWISRWDTQTGAFADGTAYELRRPRYSGSGPIPAAYSLRATPPLIGLGLLEAVPESTIAALVDVNDANGDGISGRMQVVTDTSGQPRMGRFGWKAGQPSLAAQVAAAFNRDMGVKSSMFPTLDCGASQTGCTSSATAVADAAITALVRYVSLLGVPARRDLTGASQLAGETLFGSAGCATCHRAQLVTGAFHPKAELRGQTIRPYTDLLLHDMGTGLADNLPEGIASGAEWRTPPLWGIGHTADVTGGEAYLHDGRARTLSEAILWHGGEGQAARNAFVAMTATQRAQLLAFLQSI
ncbi:MAG: c-type cytochrome [Deltaproteobacteria bacterium]|nr:c-type cytochrome [Deltaproteobacteria bacterium]